LDCLLYEIDSLDFITAMLLLQCIIDPFVVLAFGPYFYENLVGVAHVAFCAAVLSRISETAGVPRYRRATTPINFKRGAGLDTGCHYSAINRMDV
jgi:hypothetical protein